MKSGLGLRCVASNVNLTDWFMRKWFHVSQDLRAQGLRSLVLIFVSHLRYCALGLINFKKLII